MQCCIHASVCYSDMFGQHLDFWSDSSSFNDTVFLRVRPQQSDLLDKRLNDAGISHDVVVSDLQRSVGVMSARLYLQCMPTIAILN